MTSVSTTDAVGYGVKMIGYALVLGIVGGPFATFGSNLMSGAMTTSFSGVEPNWFEFVGGALVFLVGFVVLVAGATGLLYKVIADGVRQGNHPHA